MAASELEIANLALSALKEAPLSVIDTSNDRAVLFTLHYIPARDELLRLARWNFARTYARLTPTWVQMTSVSSASGLVKITLAAHGLTTGTRLTTRNTSTNGTWYITVLDVNNFTLDGSQFVDTTAGQFTIAPQFGWAYRMALPADCLRVMSINDIEAGMGPANYEIAAGNFLFTNVSLANLLYTAKITDVTQFDPLFTKALTIKLASVMCMGIKGSMQQRQQLEQEFRQLNLLDAEWVDAVEPRSKVIGPAHGSATLQSRYGWGGWRP